MIVVVIVVVIEGFNVICITKFVISITMSLQCHRTKSGNAPENRKVLRRDVRLLLTIAIKRGQ